MAIITTARILADKALLHTCGQECVDWAISMLEQGRTGRSVAMLAGISPPFNHFEVADYRDRALRELGIADISGSEALTTYAAELLRLALAGDGDLISALRIIKGKRQAVHRLDRPSWRERFDWLGSSPALLSVLVLHRSQSEMSMTFMQMQAAT